MFGNRTTSPHKKPNVGSFDFKLIFIFHLCMMGLMASHGAVPVTWQIGVVVVLAVILGAASHYHRHKNHWHWRGVGVKNVFSAVGVLLLGAFFLGSALPANSLSSPAFFPWFAAGAAIILFGMLAALKIVSLDEDEFLQNCGEFSPVITTPPPLDDEPPWQKRARRTFRYFFFGTWLVGVTFFWQFNTVYAHGTVEPTIERTAALTNHGKTVYVTPAEKQRVEFFEILMMLSVAASLFSVFLLQVVYKIDMMRAD